MMKKQRGFTLIEIMVVVAIMAILMAIAVPSFSDMIRSNNISAQANDFMSAVNLARSEAIRRGAPVCIKKSSTVADHFWTTGWTVFTDAIPTRIITSANYCATAGTTIQTYPALTNGNTMEGKSASYADAIRFNAFGVAVDIDDGGIADATFNLCRQDNKANASKLLTISVTGNISSSALSC